MLPTIAVLILAVILVAGIAIVAYFAYKTVKVQQEMILNIAMFKKASDPWHLSAIRTAMEATAEEKEAPIEDPNDQPSIPNNPSDAALLAMRDAI